MKIIQTFWSSGRNPLEHSFGWPHAEYNLMSWTLSCLSLREHFDQVELYTDKRGYEVLDLGMITGRSPARPVVMETFSNDILDVKE